MEKKGCIDAADKNVGVKSADRRNAALGCSGDENVCVQPAAHRKGNLSLGSSPERLSEPLAL